jgi:hypothetical protein
MPPSTAASEIEPLYDPAASPVEVAVTVKVAEEPLATTAGEGEIESHDPPVVVVAVGVIVTLPPQAPITLIVKVCVPGFCPASLENVCAVAEGACNVQGGWTVRETVTTWGLPTGWCVTLSVAAIVTLPLYDPAVRPVSATPTAVLDDAASVTVPLAVAVSHVPPAGVVAVVAVQLRAWEQAPLALIFTAWVAGAAWPATPWKVRAGTDAAMVQGGCTVNVTAMLCGLPTAAWPVLSVPLRVIVPL